MHTGLTIAKKLIRAGLGLVLIGGFAVWGAPNVSAEVTIVAFNAQSGGAGQIKLTWMTAGERKNWGFNLERSTDQKNWQHLGASPSVKSQSPCIQSVRGAAYEFMDSGLAVGTQYYYRLQMYGQPCGDANSYHDQIVSAAVSASPATSTPIGTPLPSATPITPGMAASTPTATPLPSPTSIPTRTISNPASASANVLPTASQTLAGRSPTKVAVVPSGSTPSSSNQNAATSSSPPIEPSPVVEVEQVSPDEPGENEEPMPAQPVADSRLAEIAQFLSSHSGALLRGGVIGLAGVFGFASLVCGVLAVYLSSRPDLRR